MSKTFDELKIELENNYKESLSPVNLYLKDSQAREATYKIFKQLHDSDPIRFCGYFRSIWTSKPVDKLLGLVTSRIHRFTKSQMVRDTMFDYWKAQDLDFQICFRETRYKDTFTIASGDLKQNSQALKELIDKVQ